MGCGLGDAHAAASSLGFLGLAVPSSGLLAPEVARHLPVRTRGALIPVVLSESLCVLSTRNIHHRDSAEQGAATYGTKPYAFRS